MSQEFSVSREDREKQFSLVARRRKTDQAAGRLFFSFSVIPLGLAILILLMLIYKSWPIMKTHSILHLLIGRVWMPDDGRFGFLPFISGTVWVTLAALIIAVPPCLLTSIYLSEYASRRLCTIMKPLFDLLAAIPSVVYGVWGTLAIVPFIQNQVEPFILRHGASLPFMSSSNPTGFGILAGAVVLAVMITPFIVSILYEIMSTVPKGLKDASLAVGATKLQTLWQVVLPQSLPGIIAGIMFGASRALGETMAVLMVVGNVAQVPHSLLDAAYPLPALIANNYGEMMSIPLYDSALMMAALILAVIVLLSNITSASVLRRILERKQ